MEIQGNEKSQLEEFKKYFWEGGIWVVSCGMGKNWTESGEDGKPAQKVDIGIYEESLLGKRVRTNKRLAIQWQGARVQWGEGLTLIRA